MLIRVLGPVDVQPSFRVLSLPDATEISPTFDLGPLITGPGSAMTSVAFDPRRPRVVGTVENGAAMIVNTENWVVERVVTDEESGGISAVAFAADADVLVTRDNLGGIAQRDPETFEVRQRIDGGTSGSSRSPWGPYLSANGEYLLTTRDDVPRLWHLPSGTLLGAFPIDEGRKHGGDSGPDGLRLATLVGEHALVWDLNVDEWMATACRAAGRNMTNEEWELFGPSGDYQVTCPQWSPGQR